MELAIPVPSRSPYETVLGRAFASLHAHVRRAHLPPLRAEGTLDVAADGSDLVWTRHIGECLLRTRQYASASRIVERAGLARVSFDLAVEDGALFYRQSSIHVAGLPVPTSLTPRVDAVVSATTDGWRVVVTVTWRGRIICRYGGALRAS